MRPSEFLIFTITGFLVWLLATAFYGVFGYVLVEGSFWTYVVNSALAAAAFGALFRGLVQSRRLGRRLWLAAAVAFAGPGLLAELAVFANMNAFFAQASPEALGRYAGFIAFVYLSLPAFAWPTQGRAIPRRVAAEAFAPRA